MIQSTQFNLNQRELSRPAKIDMLERRRGKLLKQLCKIANEIKSVDNEIQSLECGYNEAEDERGTDQAANRGGSAGGNGLPPWA